MPLLPAEALERKLNFLDFTKVEKAMPKKGTYDTAAQTFVGIGADGIGVTKQKVDGKTVHKVNEITVRIVFDSKSWVASYVLDKWRDDDRAALRGHEQAHYMIGALSGRDYLDALDALRKNNYAKAQDGMDAINAVKAQYTKEKIQKIQDAYDTYTHHDAVSYPEEQSAWTKAIENARTNGANLRVTLKAAGLIP